jgi:hypothetical protein
VALELMRSITISSILKTSSYWSRLIAIRWQLLFSLLVFWIVNTWLKNEYGQDDSTLWLVMNLFLQLVQWALIGIVTFSILSALATWLYFRNGIKNKSLSVQVKFGDGQKAEAGFVPLQIQVIGSVLRPFLGTIRGQLIFSGSRFSDGIILDGNISKQRHWWRAGIGGNGSSYLHDRGIYDVETVLISFYDMLGLVSLPYRVSLSQQLYTLPLAHKEQSVKANPSATEEQKHRIEIPKRVEGEHVNYKEFETGDNIHRIVWKIYAKSGQLVVRIPEIKDPYASHLYLYTSFYAGLDLIEGLFEKELLNIYKDQVRNLFESLKRNEAEVRMPPDQEIPKLSGITGTNNELFQIAATAWQNQNPPSLYIDSKKAAFVCLPSLITTSELETIIKKLPLTVPILVVKLSEAIPSPFLFSLKDIFFKPEGTPSDSLKQPWLFSSLRKNLVSKEKEMDSLLKKRGAGWVMSSIQFEK